MIPAGREATFFAVALHTEFSGPGIIIFRAALLSARWWQRQVLYRQALLTLIIFFIAGLITLYLTDTDKAIHEAGNLLPEEAASVNASG